MSIDALLTYVRSHGYPCLRHASGVVIFFDVVGPAGASVEAVVVPATLRSVREAMGY